MPDEIIINKPLVHTAQSDFEAALARNLDEIKKYFPKGTKVTFLAVNPAMPNGNFVMTEETDFEEINKAMKRFIENKNRRTVRA